MFFDIRAVVASVALVVIAGCGDKPVRQVCMGGGGGNSLVEGAATLRLDVYGSSASCVNGLLADGAGLPSMSHTYVAGEAITLDVPPGPHTLVLTTFADAAGTMALGEACTQTTLRPGSQICFDLTVVPAPVEPDMSVAACTVSPNSCPPGYRCDGTRCQPSCDVDAGAQICGATCCNAINGTCAANCALTCSSGYADCNGDPADGCETNLAAAGKKLCAGACIAASSCCTSADCNMPPAPGACYLTGGTCSAPGGSCAYTQQSGSQICNNGTTCCNGVNGTCSDSCGLTCTSGFFDCNTNSADGCETACAPAHASGKCVGTSGCGIASCNSGFADCNSSATDGCECGTSCCTNPMTSKQDCLVNTHTDGWGHTFSACYPVGTPGVSGSPGTPGTGYGLQFARDAAAADTSIVGNCTADADCQTYASSATCVNGACQWPNANCTSGQEYIQSLCKYTLAGNGKPSDCTCWAFAATTGTCGSAPCADAIGHTNHVTSNYCPCVAATNGTYQ